MSTGKSGVNGSKPSCSVHRCLPSILLSLPLSYSMPLIGVQCWGMSSSQSSARCQSREYNADVGKKEAEKFFLNVNCGREERLFKKYFKKVPKRMDIGVVGV